MPTVGIFVQCAAGGAYENIQRVPSVFRQEQAGEEVEDLPAIPAILLYHPEEIFYVGLQ